MSSGLTPLDRAALAADPRNERRERVSGRREAVAGAWRGGDHSVPRSHWPMRATRSRTGARKSRGAARNPLDERRAAQPGGESRAPRNARLLLDLGADPDERMMLNEVEEPTPSWGTPLWYAALAGRRDIAELLLDRGADPNANVYASGWPLRNAWRHKDDSVKRLLLDRGAKPQPYMVAEAHDEAEAKRLLENDASEGLASELVWSAADHGCPAIVEMALKNLNVACQRPEVALGAHSTDSRGGNQSSGPRRPLPLHGRAAGAWDRRERFTLRPDRTGRKHISDKPDSRGMAGPAPAYFDWRHKCSQPKRSREKSRRLLLTLPTCRWKH